MPPDDAENQAFDLAQYTQGCDTSDPGNPRRIKENPTNPDLWGENTPTITPDEMRPYLEAVRRSSQSSIHQGNLCALEILHLDNVFVSAQNLDAVENEAGKLVTRYIQNTVEDHTRWLQKQLADLTAELIQLRGTKKDLTRKLVRQRKSILDFARDGDLDKLKAVVYGDITDNHPKTSILK